VPICVAQDAQGCGARTHRIAMDRMTPGEANAVNVLLGYLAGQETEPPAPVIHALEMLASRGHYRIQTGWDENAVRKHWPYAYSEDAPDGG
jgi:hypothetical protein